MKKLNLKIIVPIILVAIVVIVGIVVLTNKKGTSNETTEVLQIGETYKIKGGDFEITLNDIQYASEKKRIHFKR